MQAVINVIDYGMDIQAGIDAPRIHHQWLPNELSCEPHDMSPDTMKILTGYSHKFSPVPETSHPQPE